MSAIVGTLFTEVGRRVVGIEASPSVVGWLLYLGSVIALTMIIVALIRLLWPGDTEPWASALGARSATEADVDARHSDSALPSATDEELERRGKLGAMRRALDRARAEAPGLRIAKAFDSDEHGRMPDGAEIRIRRTATLRVETTDTDVDHVRLNLLRFTPQGRSGAIFLRQRHDLPPYTQSSVTGYRVQRGAPVVFDLCSWANPELQPSAEKLIALHYATPPGMEPNGIRPVCRYFFEVQALGDGATSEPTTFSAEVDASGELVSQEAIWPT